MSASGNVNHEWLLVKECKDKLVELAALTDGDKDFVQLTDGLSSLLLRLNMWADDIGSTESDYLEQALERTGNSGVLINCSHCLNRIYDSLKMISAQFNELKDKDRAVYENSSAEITRYLTVAEDSMSRLEAFVEIIQISLEPSLLTHEASSSGLHMKSSPSNETFLSNLPRQRVAQYVQRPELEQVLKANLFDKLGTNTERSTVAVLHGLGGAGKTQLALNYTQTHWMSYQGVFWIDCSNKQKVKENIESIYNILHRYSELSTAKNLSTYDTLQCLKSWFSGRPKYWLLIIDGANYVNSKDEPDFIDLNALIPSSPSVQVLVTSRNSDVRRITRSEGIEVGNLKPDQALRLFMESSELNDAEISNKERGVAMTIVEELGCFALAIQAAGAAISHSPSMKADLERYLFKYRGSKRDILRQSPDFLVTQYETDIYTTWEITYEHVAHRSQVAANLFRFLVWLDPENISLKLFNIALEVNNLKEDKYVSWEEVLFDRSTADSHQLEVALSILTRYSLLNYNELNRKYSMHRLVQQWGYISLPKDMRTKICLSVVHFLVCAISHCKSDPSAHPELFPHVVKNFQVVTEDFLEMSASQQKWILDQLFWYGEFASLVRCWSDSERIQKFLVNELTKTRGSTHPDTSCALFNLAATLQSVGRFREARLLRIEVLKHRKKLLGDKHPYTISAHSSLVTTLESEGNLDEARIQQEQVLRNGRQTFGDDHENTISAKNHLAVLLLGQGNFDTAESMFIEVLNKRKRMLGAQHPDTISTTDNLAMTHAKQGSFHEAAWGFREVHEKRKEVLGDRHPDTISAMNNLARTYEKQGNLHEAVEGFREVHEKRRAVLGNKHPDTISAMNNLARTLDSQGKNEDVKGKGRELSGEQASEDKPVDVIPLSYGLVFRPDG